MPTVEEWHKMDLMVDLRSARAEIERLRAIIHRAERELENILVSTTKVHPDKIMSPTLKELKSVNEQVPTCPKPAHVLGLHIQDF
jgi:hypothetical protein